MGKSDNKRKSCPDESDQRIRVPNEWAKVPQEQRLTLDGSLATVASGVVIKGLNIVCISSNCDQAPSPSTQLGRVLVVGVL
jgi:hypothetical protein